MSLMRTRRWAKAGLVAGLMATLLLFGALLPGQQEGGRRVRQRVTPVYPQLAREMKLMGAVRLEVQITAGGTVKNVRALGGHPVLVQSAMEAVRKWRFEPGPADTTQIMEFKFNPSS